MLTRFITRPNIRAIMKELFPNPGGLPKLSIMAPPLTRNFALVGGAFDYFLRFFVSSRWPKCEVRSLTAEKAPTILKLLRQPKKAIRQYELKIKQSISILNDVSEVVGISNAALTACLELAQFEPVVRRAYIPPNLGLIQEEDIADLRCLIEIIDWRNFTPTKQALLNPTFGFGSQMVGGADADLIIDGKLIELKTVKDLKLRRIDLNQVIGYFCLAAIDKNEHEGPDMAIQNICIYYSRYAHFFELDVQEFITPIKLEQLIECFKLEADVSSRVVKIA